MSEGTSIAGQDTAHTSTWRQILDKQLVAGRRKHIQVDTRVTDVFCVSASRLYNEDLTQLRVEAGSNIPTVALRAVGGDGKGAQCLGA
jgi:hypothetical protein